MNKIPFILLSILSLDVFANGCGGEYQAATGTCRIIGSDGKEILYNSTSPQSSYGNQVRTQKIIQEIEVKVPSKYGALAFDKTTGSFAGSVNANSLAEAKKAAIHQCQDKNCKVTTWVKNGCIAAAWGTKGNKGALYQSADKQGRAEKAAFNRCKRAGASGCKIVFLEACSTPDVSKY